jgi:hypothetical protein
VIDHFANLGLRNPIFDLDRVPMLFVHVITGADLFVPIAQLEREIGIAFQVRPRRNLIEGRDRKNFAADFEHERVRSERRAFSSA